MPNPPAVAQLLLDALLAVETRESVSGDLLEEYRESRVATTTRSTVVLSIRRMPDGPRNQAGMPRVLLLAYGR